ncbi:fluoride efflux transporter CrcB [Pseudofulvimonas gallinarii]|uniref:Fluoride-specific ion channel FluC n=1 Tax=Pseudofulvimonas gallinarii TaxID=634155 RepID=A0A4S3KYV1_9GAMM|nr:fluoride efflux transporter CrcB [Pseudofulvimonas gallinarii]TCS96158.1 camphor resistance protein CrcB [Pseudofulvimonas gallinarii]THD14593.1 hypothetical protein B1808_02730 [Pseudofulvimonas gallinarii]
MHAVLLVGSGGFLGAVARYALAAWIVQVAGTDRFPWGTLVVNVAGCLAVSVLAGAAERFNALGPDARLFLVTGVLGGFTTFSAFGLETVQMLRRGDAVNAALYAGASMGLGVFAVWLGLRLLTVHR